MEGQEQKVDAIMDSLVSQVFIDSFNEVAGIAHGNSLNKGFWNKDLNIGEKLMLIVSEAAEAMEADRLGNPPDDKIPEYSGLEAELADVIVRIMDLGEGCNLRVAEALIAKMEFNATRDKMHGGKLY